MKSEKIHTLIGDFLHGDLPKEIQRLFRRWMVEPTDRKAKDQALLDAWNELLQEPATGDYRAKLAEANRRIDALERPAARKVRLGGWRLAAAVAALVVLVAGIEYVVLESCFGRYTASVCLVTARNSKGEFELPDGSRVWLNGNSRLTFPESFDEEHRSVRLDGEAFFRVKPDPHHPFRVDMETMQVEVLGTEFDARHHKGARYAETILQSGRVRVHIPGLRDPLFLKPDERLLLDGRTGRVSVSPVAATDYSSWTSNRLVFTNKSLSSILVNLERWYNVRFSYDSTIDLSAKLSFQIEYESLEETLRLIERIAPVRYKLHGQTVSLEPK
ncbi:Fe2+-dicitrate sensor protein [Alistipes sp. An54]|uniref:FecR family protein n=1 Tax=Alistipes sp. An54 TaxID=1965645 RepID=UPI000B3932CA|nr:FecR family protein [Alistipes sp. An54]OUN76083.1 Fe2+-dicitrate sensor protein [Alistipes sp. An54]